MSAIESSRHKLVTGFLIAMLSAVSVPANGEESQFKSSTWSNLRQQPSSSVLDPGLGDQNRNVFRQAPALTGRFELNNQTFLPFIGAGFGGGYTNDRDRALGSNGLFHNPALSGELGKNMMPNEFNLGLRIPF
jgi:hypothetical protein